MPGVEVPRDKSVFRGNIDTAVMFIHLRLVNKKAEWKDVYNFFLDPDSGDIMDHDMFYEECYPRYKYTLKYSRPLWMRYGTVMRNLDFKDECPLPTFGTVNVVYLRKSKTGTQETPITASKYTDRICFTSENYDSFFRSKRSRTNGTFIYVASSETLQDVRKVLDLNDQHIIVIKKGDGECSKVRDSEKFIICQPQELPKIIDRHLERMVIETFYEMMKDLECLLKFKESDASFDEESAKHSGTRIDPGNTTASSVITKTSELHDIARLRKYPKRKLEVEEKQEEAKLLKFPPYYCKQIVTRSVKKKQIEGQAHLHRVISLDADEEGNISSIIPVYFARQISKHIVTRKEIIQSEQEKDVVAKVSTDQRPESVQPVTIHSGKNKILDSTFPFISYWEEKLDAAKRHIEKQYGSVAVRFRHNLLTTLMSEVQPATNISEREMIQFISKHTSEVFTDREIRNFFRHNNNDLKAIYELVSNEHHLKASLKKHVAKVNATKNVVEQLHAEMRGMLYRSSVPAEDWPTFDIDTSMILSKADANEIRSVKGVTSVGYRFRTLEISLDDSCDDKERQSAIRDVKLILTKRNIEIYRFCYEQKQLTPFREVGSELTIYTRATLGGFAKFENDADTCILLARHFAQQGPSVFIQNNQTTLLFAHVLPFGNHIEPSVDIALAKVVRSEHQNCRLQFKDETGNPMPSILCLFTDLQSLIGLPVYIWGASSKPGHGVIVSPAHYRNDEEDPVLRIEDRELVEGQDNTRFARLGDSGAIVCAETIDGDTVLVIAMFSGSPNFSHTEANPREKRHYIAFRLNLGLDQLQREHDRAVTLY